MLGQSLGLDHFEQLWDDENQVEHHYNHGISLDDKVRTIFRFYSSNGAMATEQWERFLSDNNLLGRHLTLKSASKLFERFARPMSGKGVTCPSTRNGLYYGTGNKLHTISISQFRMNFVYVGKLLGLTLVQIVDTVWEHSQEEHLPIASIFEPIQWEWWEVMQEAFFVLRTASDVSHKPTQSA